MHVIWKRPDGYHGASPTDYKAVQLKNHSSKIWLHKKDEQWFPFRISGGWQDEDLTKRLNKMVNLLDAPRQNWLEKLIEIFGHSQANDGQVFLDETTKWMSELKANLKGDTWEVEIMEAALTEIESRISEVKDDFLAKLKN